MKKTILFASSIASEKSIMEWYDFHKLGVYTATMPSM